MYRIEFCVMTSSFTQKQVSTMFINVLVITIFMFVFAPIASSQTWTSPDGFLSITPPDVNQFKQMATPPSPFVGIWVSNDETMKFGVMKTQIPPKIQFIQSSVEEGLATEINGKVNRLPTKQVSGHEIWNMTAKGESVEITQAIIRHDGSLYKLMAVTVGGKPDVVAVNRFIDSLSIVQPASITAESSIQLGKQPVQSLGGGIDLHTLSKSIGGAAALLGIGLLVYYLTRGKKNHQS
jgi:hypothetical protein